MCNVVDMSNVVDLFVQCCASHVHTAWEYEGGREQGICWQPPFRIHRHNLRTSLKHLNLVLQTEKKERGGGRIGLGFKD